MNQPALTALATLAAAAVLCALAACSSNGASTTADHSASTIVLPPAGAVADYQLGGSYEPSPDVRTVTRESTDQPVPDMYSICYVNGFQSQPGEHWPLSLLLTDSAGAPMADPGWPDEYFFDISTADNRTDLAQRLTTSIERCASSGFQAVEFDNLDSYTRTGGALSRADAVNFAALLVDAAHDRGLAAGQKNAPDLAHQGATSIGFDFVVSEECFRYTECESYTRAYGANVIDIEYVDDLLGTIADVSASPGRLAYAVPSGASSAEPVRELRWLRASSGNSSTESIPAPTNAAAVPDDSSA
ncbi:hypothetical protein HNR05_001921 [Leifsonia psychrotolerans]|uniref:Glycoside-hydrolase family GH114 TIM-barrel domain-containing protein n=1 Tax=Glaciibacter psychrotolerans TaxID=670054 RepID=A0A7Z0EEL5_9MICO|nr:hypothetical protein [Leifsonia psychrotolerans]